MPFGWDIGWNMVDRFSICLPFTLKQECVVYTGTPDDWSNPKNFSNDHHDPGGKTQCGIIQREYDLWRKAHGLATQDVRKITQDEGTAIYRISYWQPHGPFLPAGLDLSFFDESVNAGDTEAIKILQVALGIPEDGDWGPQTQAAATLASMDLAAHIERFTSRRIEVYKESKGFQYFGTDWVRRAEQIGAAALQMAKEVSLVS